MILIAAYYAVFSVIAYAVYAIDKKAAIKQRRRISEKTLHLLSLIGGWPGAWIAQQRMRHKTQKTAFKVIYWLTASANLVCLIGLTLYPYQG